MYNHIYNNYSVILNNEKNNTLLTKYNIQSSFYKT